MSLRTAMAHRNLLYLLSMKELRTRYKKSVLGWAWSLLNPVSQMLIFTVIFTYVFVASPRAGDPSGLKNFPLYFLCGLLPWNFFAITTSVAMGNVQGSTGLIKKVSFPHEHLVFSVLVAQFVTLLIETLILVFAMMLAGHDVLVWLPFLLPLYVLWALFTAGVSLALAAFNVFFHDVQYLWGILAQVLFYATPVIYFTAGLPQDRLMGRAMNKLATFGPTGTYITAFHNVLYDGRFPSLSHIGYLAALAIGSFGLGSAIFNRLSPRFAEEM
ncbi:MAG: ABC transporter permease [Ilumatobacteraceae bacterium]